MQVGADNSCVLRKTSARWNNSNKKGCETVDYLKSRKNAYAVLLSGLVLGIVIAFLINDDPDTSTLVAAGAIGVVIGEAIMFWRWSKQRKTKQRED